MALVLKMSALAALAVMNHHEVKELLVTEDGNAFLATRAGKQMCGDHCKRTNQKFATISKETAEALGDAETIEVKPAKEAKVVDLKDTKPTKGGEGSEGGKGTEGGEGDDPNAWKKLKFNQIVAFAKEKGLDPKTKTTQGTKVLIAEVETLLNAEVVPGANPTTNHAE